jgi:hypothetical protein
VYSPHIHRQLSQAHIDDLRRQAAGRKRIEANCGESTQQGAAPLSAYLKRTLERLAGRVAGGATA